MILLCTSHCDSVVFNLWQNLEVNCIPKANQGDPQNLSLSPSPPSLLLSSPIPLLLFLPPFFLPLPVRNSSSLTSTFQKDTLSFGKAHHLPT